MKKSRVREIIREEIRSVLNESQSYDFQAFADIIEKSDLDDKLFAPQTKDTAVNFLRQGNPSKAYMDKITALLQQNNLEVPSMLDTSKERLPKTTKIKGNPYKSFKPTRHRGGNYTGD